jgi:hypothetical protein
MARGRSQQAGGLGRWRHGLWQATAGCARRPAALRRPGGNQQSFPRGPRAAATAARPPPAPGPGMRRSARRATMHGRDGRRRAAPGRESAEFPPGPPGSRNRGAPRGPESQGPADTAGAGPSHAPRRRRAPEPLQRDAACLRCPSQQRGARAAATRLCGAGEGWQSPPLQGGSTPGSPMPMPCFPARPGGSTPRFAHIRALGAYHCK